MAASRRYSFSYQDMSAPQGGTWAQSGQTAGSGTSSGSGSSRRGRDQMLMDSVSRLFGGNVGGTGSWAQGSTADAGPAGQTAAQPAMSAADVQQALLTTPDGAPQVSGIGQSGTGAWYTQMQPGMQGIDYNALMASAPGAYNNVYGPAMEQTLNQILGRQPFQYDVNADGLYQQIKDNYIKAGRQAMMDTQGQAAALTGGYGNSYGAQAGQQAYQESLGNLANAIPQLAQQAYAQYMDQGDQLRNNLEAMRLLEGQDYSRWLDDQERYQAFLKEMPSIMQSQAAASGRLGGGRIYSQMEPDISSYGPRTGTTGTGSNGNINLEFLSWLRSEKPSQAEIDYAAQHGWFGMNQNDYNATVGYYNLRNGDNQGNDLNNIYDQWWNQHGHDN